jgi:hypothetical protein
VRLQEIIFADHIDAVLADDVVARYQKKLAGGERLENITSTLQLNYVRDQRAFTLLKDGEIIGWLQLDDEVRLFGVTYDVVRFIYLLPAFQKTRAGGAFLVALKKHLPNPLILGSDRYGGVLFHGGVELVKMLNHASRSDVSVLNLKTGEKLPLDGDIPVKPAHLTLVFENNDFPLTRLGFNIFEGAELRNFDDGAI